LVTAIGVLFLGGSAADAKNLKKWKKSNLQMYRSYYHVLYIM
jgi:hypothetical protein